MSLHDLIYSQPSSESVINEETPSPLLPRKKKPKQQDTAFLAETAALDAFYGIPSQAHPVTSSAPDVIISNGIERRRKRKRGRPPSSKRRQEHAFLPEKEEEELWETISEAKCRIERTCRKKKYKEIQTRWKQRSHALQEEVDYGNSVQHLARKIMTQTQNQQSQEETTRDTRKPPAVPDSQQDIDIHSSDEEQQQETLGSLWTSMTSPQQEDSDDDSTNVDAKQPDPNDYTTWDYYQLGYDTPRYDDLRDFYYNNHARHQGGTFQMNFAAREERIKEMESVTYTPVWNGGIRNIANERHYLDLKEPPTTCHTHSSFHHYSCLRAMAAKVLIGSDAGKNVELENRLLRELYCAPTQKMGREYHVLTQAMEHGCDYVLFQSHKWKQRTVVARALGMTTEYHLTGPQHRIGYSLERKSTQREGLEFQKRVVRLLSDGKIPYKPDGDSDSAVKEHNHVLMDNSLDNLLSESSPACESPEINHVETTDMPQSDARGENDDEEMFGEIPCVKLESGSDIDAETTPVTSGDVAKLVDPDASSFRTYLGSEGDYVHRPGTLPPVPLFPLDETGVILGGEDKYSRIHRTAKIDDATYTVTLSTLLARLGRARLEMNTEAIEELFEQIMTYVDEAVQENVVQLENFHFMRRKRKVQPSALYYKALMGLCSIVASGIYPQEFSDGPGNTGGHNRKAIGGEGLMDGDTDVELASSLNDRAVNIKEVAQTIHNHCADCPNSSMLTIFPRIHITTALALIAKNLPASAAEILSRPFDELSHRTPFDIMRRTLEHLEGNQLLVDSYTANTGGTTVSVGYLEHVVHQATEIFQHASEMDPTDILYQAWHVSGLAASLLLCSGNAIGSRAHVNPSSKEREDDFDMIFSSSDAFTANNHEVRQKMSKFSDVRAKVASALKKMLLMACTQENSTGSLMSSAILEWKQVIALLVGPRGVGDETTAWSDVRRLHSWFAVHWAITEKTTVAQCMIEDMARGGYASTDNELGYLASAVENDPSDVSAWRCLVRTLGPVGVRVSSRQRKECKQRCCAECKRVRKGLNVDHAMHAVRKENTDWWGYGRLSWWEKHVVISDEVSVNATANTIFQVSECIELKLSQETSTMVARDENPEKRAARPVGDVSRVGEEHMNWLDDAALSSAHTYNNAGFDASQEVEVDDLLPKSFEERIRSRGQDKDPTNSLVFDAQGDLRLELLCYKIMATCHLYGVCNELISVGIWHLAQECREYTTASDEWRCLMWLSSMGLNIPQILHDVYVQAKKRDNGVSVYSSEEKEAVRVGVDIFGKQWAKIRDFFDVFKDSPRWHVKHIYTSMRKRGEL